MRTYHVIGICLLSQSASEKRNQEKKPTNLCAPLASPLASPHVSAMSVQSCYFDYRRILVFVINETRSCLLDARDRDFIV